MLGRKLSTRCREGFSDTAQHLLVASSLLIGAVTTADAQVVWSSSSGSAWLTGSNWTGGSVPTGSEVARFSANPSGVGGVGINFNSITVNGDTTAGQRTQLVGAIEMIDRAQNFLIGNSATALGANGFLVLNGATVNSFPQTVLRNATSNSLTLRNTQANGSRTMGVRLGGAVNVVQVDGAGSIEMDSVLSEAVMGARLEVRGVGLGQLDLTSTSNSYTGGVSLLGSQLRIAGDGSLGAVPAIVVADHITLNGGRLSMPGSGTIVIHGNRGMQVGDAVGSAFNINGSAVMRYSGVIADLPNVAGAWAKVGTSVLELGGVSTYSGTTTVSQGTLRIINGVDRLPTSTVLQLGTAGSALLGTFDLNGLNQRVAGLKSIAGTNNTTTTNVVSSASSATLTLNTPADASHVYSDLTRANSGVITGAIGISKLGAGTQAFGGANTYTGTTVITGGALLVNGSHSNGGAYTVKANGTLGGSGSIGSIVTVEAEGTIAPGQSIGTLTVSRSVTLLPQSVFVVQFDLNGADQLVVTGASSALATDDAILRLIPTGLSPGPYGPLSLTYTIASTPNNTTGVSGVFDNLVQLTSNTYQYSSGGVEGTVTYSGNTISINITAVPEPAVGSTLLLTCIALRRRRDVVAA